MTGLSQEEIVLEKRVAETEIQLDPCKAHTLTVEYRFFSRVESFQKNIEIDEDGFYCSQQKRKEREMKESQRAEKEKTEKERIEKETPTPTPTPTILALTPHIVEEDNRSAIVEP